MYHFLQFIHVQFYKLRINWWQFIISFYKTYCYQPIKRLSIEKLIWLECQASLIHSINVTFSTYDLGCLKLGIVFAPNIFLTHLTLALDANTLVDPIPAERPIMGRHQQLPFSCGCGALEVTWLIGDVDVIIWTGGDIIKTSLRSRLQRISLKIIGLYGIERPLLYIGDYGLKK